MNFKQWLLSKAVEAATSLWADEFAQELKDAVAPGGEVSQDFLNLVIERAGLLSAPQ